MLNNEKAFAYATSTIDGADYIQQGMDLRDWFAGQALVGVISEHTSPDHVDWQRNAAWKAYSIADAMMKFRGDHDK